MNQEDKDLIKALEKVINNDTATEDEKNEARQLISDIKSSSDSEEEVSAH